MQRTYTGTQQESDRNARELERGWPGAESVTDQPNTPAGQPLLRTYNVYRQQKLS